MECCRAPLPGVVACSYAVEGTLVANVLARKGSQAIRALKPGGLLNPLQTPSRSKVEEVVSVGRRAAPPDHRHRCPVSRASRCLNLPADGGATGRGGGGGAGPMHIGVVSLPLRDRLTCGESQRWLTQT